MNIEVSRRACPRRNIHHMTLQWIALYHCVYHIIISHVVENISHRREMLFTKNENILEGFNPWRIYQSILEKNTINPWNGCWPKRKKMRNPKYHEGVIQTLIQTLRIMVTLTIELSPKCQMQNWIYYLVVQSKSWRFVEHIIRKSTKKEL